MSKILLFSLLSLVASGCMTAAHLSDSENTWISTRSTGSDKVLYCQANKVDKNASPTPKCYEAEMLVDKTKYNFNFK